MRELVCVLALSVFSTSCFIRPEASAVAQGEYYASGNPSFDEFFIKLHRFQVELAAAPDGPRDVRADLTKNLGLGSDAGDDQIEIRVKEEARELERGGVRLKLELPARSAEHDPEQLSVAIRTSKSPVGDGETFVNEVQTSTTKLLRIRNRMRLGHKELERLRVQGIELDAQVDTAFRKESPWKRTEVRDNIADGQKLITLMIARTDEIEALSDKLLEVVVRAATTDAKLGEMAQVAPPPAAEPTTDEPSDEKAKKSAKPSKKGGQKASRPAAKPRPAPASKPAAPAGDEGDAPAPPKPAPAEVAPKDFEP